jgi:hypothetical protein
MLAYQYVWTRDATTDAPGSQDGGGSGAKRTAAFLLLSYYLPATVWALKRGRRKYLLYSVPFATTLWATLLGRPTAP